MSKRDWRSDVCSSDLIRESWNKGFSGSNSHKIAILEEGMKYTPISISPEQAQFLETRKFQIDEIARIFRRSEERRVGKEWRRVWRGSAVEESKGTGHV